MNILPKKLTTIASALLLGAALTGTSAMTYAQNINPNEPVSIVAEWDKTFPPRIQIISATVMDWRRGEASC